MPFSNPELHETMKQMLVSTFPERDTHLVDVGAGAGAYGALLRSHYSGMTAVEVWEPYVKQFQLENKYRSVIIGDIRRMNLKDLVRRTVVLMGDVFEHFKPDEARQLLNRMKDAEPRGIVVMVPYKYEQGPDHPDVKRFGNPHEVHEQPDLTSEVMDQRYPDLFCVDQTENTGLYLWTPEIEIGFMKARLLNAMMNLEWPDGGKPGYECEPVAEAQLVMDAWKADRKRTITADDDGLWVNIEYCQKKASIKFWDASDPKDTIVDKVMVEKWKSLRRTPA